MRIQLVNKNNDILMDLDLYQLIWLAFFAGKLTLSSDFRLNVDGVLIERPEWLEDSEE